MQASLLQLSNLKASAGQKYPHSCKNTGSSPSQPRTNRTIFDQICVKLGDAGDLPYWDSFTAIVSDALPTCEGIVETSGEAYLLRSDEIPNTNTIQEVICLNRDVGVSPLPEWYMLGVGPPSITSGVRSTNGHMIACANSSMRYRAISRLAGIYYVGSVSVAPSERGKGLGTLVTALLIRGGVRAYGSQICRVRFLHIANWRTFVQATKAEWKVVWGALWPDAVLAAQKINKSGIFIMWGIMWGEKAISS